MSRRAGTLHYVASVYMDVRIFSLNLPPTPTLTHTHTHSPGEFYAKDDLLISWGLEDQLNAPSLLPFIILTSLLCCTFFVRDLTSYMSCINQAYCSYKSSVTDSVHIFIHLFPPPLSF